jgi:hypothetical protein
MQITPSIIGTLPAGGTVALAVGPGTPPFSLSLSYPAIAGIGTAAPVAFTSAISISCDGGTAFAPLSTNVGTVAGTMLVAYDGPISQVLFAGAAGETFAAL